MNCGRCCVGSGRKAQDNQGCLPFDPYAASLDAGHWQFSNPANISQPSSLHAFALRDDRGCDLRRYTAKEARVRLAGKHILFVGDSVTRHQFEALVIWLETGEYAEPYRRDPRPYTTLLDDPGDRSSIGCGTIMRCEFHKNMTHREWFRLNLYYHNREHDFNVTALGVYKYGLGHCPVGWYPPHPAVPFDTRTLAWQGQTLSDMPSVVQRWFGAVDYAVINVGVWLPDAPWIRLYIHGEVDEAKEALARWESVVKKVSQ